MPSNPQEKKRILQCWAGPGQQQEERGHNPLPGDTNAELQLPPHWGLASCVPDVQRQVSGGLEEAWDSELSRAHVLATSSVYYSTRSQGEILPTLWTAQSGTCSCQSASSALRMWRACPHAQEPAAFPIRVSR